MSYLFLSSLALSQSTWQLKKDINGIKVLESSTQDFPFKTYKTETTISADLEKVKRILMDTENIPSFMEGISEIANVQWISENEVQFVSNTTFPLDSNRVQIKRHYAPVEVGSFEINTIVVQDTNEGKESVQTSKYFSLWILVNAGNGNTYVRHIICYPSDDINQRITAIENLKRLVAQ